MGGAATADRREWLTKREAARRLAVGLTTFDRIMHSKSMPVRVRKVPGRLSALYHRGDVEELVARMEEEEAAAKQAILAAGPNRIDGRATRWERHRARRMAKAAAEAEAEAEKQTRKEARRATR